MSPEYRWPCGLVTCDGEDKRHRATLSLLRALQDNILGENILLKYDYRVVG
jgi:hypothetical protein